MTPRELIEMLLKWNLDKEFELVVSSRGPGHYHVGLMQGTNSINLDTED